MSLGTEDSNLSIKISLRHIYIVIWELVGAREIRPWIYIGVLKEFTWTVEETLPKFAIYNFDNDYDWVTMTVESFPRRIIYLPERFRANSEWST